MFNGSVPIILDSLKQHYFIDRDGKMFRHVLNFLRTGTLAIPDEFDEVDLLMEEARFFELSPLVRSINDYRRRQQQNLRKRTAAAACGTPLTSVGTIKPASPEQNGSTLSGCGGTERSVVDCVVMNVSPDLGERITLSADCSILDELFPEIGSATLADYRGGWNSTSPLASGDIDVVGCGPCTIRNGLGDSNDSVVSGTGPSCGSKAPGGGSGSGCYVIRFPLNGFCRLNSLQVMERLMSNGFDVCGSTGAGVEGQQFSEYVFRRKRRCPTADLLIAAPPASSNALVLPVGHAAGRSTPGCSDDEPLSLAPVIKRERLCD